MLGRQLSYGFVEMLFPKDLEAAYHPLEASFLIRLRQRIDQAPLKFHGYFGDQ